MNNTDDNLPELPEGFVLYGKGPLKVPALVETRDIKLYNPRCPEFGWQSSGLGGGSCYYYALRVGSDAAVANGVSRKPFNPRPWSVADKDSGHVVETTDKNAPPVSSPAYKQLEAEFIQQRTELADARNRIVDLEKLLAAETTGREMERMESLKFLWKVNGALGISGTGSCPSETLARAAELFNKEQTLEHQLNSETTDAAQRIINLQDECGRLTELWHGAEGRLALMAEARNNALASSAQWETACRGAAAKLDTAKRESTNCILLSRIEEACRERDNWEQTAAQHLRNEHFYRDLLGQCAELLGDECRRSDDGKLIPKGDFLAQRVPEVLKEGMAAFDTYKRRLRELVATELGKATNNILKGL